jgi:hypothetical protein
MRNSPHQRADQKPFSVHAQEKGVAFLESLKEIYALLKAHPYWYGLFVAFWLAFYVPARWLWSLIWGVPGSAVSWQIIVPFCVLVLIWASRSALFAVWKRPKNRGMMGHPVFFIVGWCLYLLSLLFQGPLPAFFGLLLMTWGGIYWLFGAVLMRSLLVPFFFSFLTVPPPQTLVTKLKVLLQLALAHIVRPMLNRLGIPTNIQEVPSAEANHQFVFSGSMLSLTYNSNGAGALFVTGFFSLFYGAVRHYPLVRCLFLSLAGGIFGFLLEIIRVFIAALLYSRVPPFSLWLIDISPWWLAFLGTGGVMWLDWRFLRAETKLGRFLLRVGRPIEQLMRQINRPLDAALESSAKVATRAGRAIEKSGRPFERFAGWFEAKMRPLRRTFRNSNRGLEGLLGKFDRKKRRRRRRSK